VLCRENFAVYCRAYLRTKASDRIQTGSDQQWTPHYGPQTGVVHTFTGDKKHICFSNSTGRLISCHLSVSVHNSDAAKMSRMKKVFREVLRKLCVCVFACVCEVR
jgi:Tat protein secretion system quality control protein TatD with DNase activity